jgi:hypothetical protein
MILKTLVTSEFASLHLSKLWITQPLGALTFSTMFAATVVGKPYTFGPLQIWFVGVLFFLGFVYGFSMKYRFKFGTNSVLTMQAYHLLAFEFQLVSTGRYNHHNSTSL